MKIVKDYMRKVVIYFSPEDTIFEVSRVLSENRISGAPVLKRGKLVGIISETDIVKFLSKKLLPSPKVFTSYSLMILHLLKSQIEFKKEIKKILRTKVENVMTKNVYTVKEHTPIIEVAEMFSKYDVSRFPVVDEKNRLVGIISKTDLLRALSEL